MYKQKLRALLNSLEDVSLMHTKVYKSLKNKPKLKKQNALVQLVTGILLMWMGVH